MAQLERYGLSENESRVYLFLLESPAELSVVNIARSLKLGRTPVYNALDRLEDKGLATKLIAESGYGYSAATPDNLEHYWSKKITRLEAMGSKLPDIVSALESLSAPASYKSEINYFTGRRGLEQITYNSLKAENDLYIYEINTSMTAFINKATSEKFRRIWAEQGTVIHQLTNNTEFEDFTEVEEITGDLWDIRHIDPSILAINFETLIYNDTVALYSPVGREIFGIEIKNQNLAKMQIQIFKAMQQLSTPMEKLSTRGAARLPNKP